MRRFAARILIALGLLHVVVLATPVLHYWTKWLSGAWESPRGAVLVVFAGDDPHDGELTGYSSYWRAVYAVRVCREHQFRSLIVSGGGGTGASIAAYMTSHGIDPGMIRLETSSTSTRENALFTAAMLANEQEPVSLLTSDYHMRRAHASLRKAGIAAVSVPIPDARKRSARWQYRWWVFLDLTTETTKLCWYALKGFV